MHGFGSHTYKMVNETGLAQYVKFHWVTDQVMERNPRLTNSRVLYCRMLKVRSNWYLWVGRQKSVSWGRSASSGHESRLLHQRLVCCNCSRGLSLLDPQHPSHDLCGGRGLGIQSVWRHQGLAPWRLPSPRSWKNDTQSKSNKLFCWSGTVSFCTRQLDPWHWGRFKWEAQTYTGIWS